MLWLVKIWQVSSCRKFMQHLETCLLWQLKLTEFCVNLWFFLTVFFHWTHKMKYSCYQESSVINGWFVYWVFGWDRYPPNVSEQKIYNVLAKQRSDTGGLDFEMNIKETLRITLTTNIDIVDRLINGQLGTILRIDVSQKTQKSTIIYIKFGDSKAGKNLTHKLNNQVAKKIVLYHLNQY